jgi:hypothetical protein
MDRMSTIMVKLEDRERRSPFLVCQMSKCDDTSFEQRTTSGCFSSDVGGSVVTVRHLH